MKHVSNYFHYLALVKTHNVLGTGSDSRHNWSHNFSVLQLKVFFFHRHTEHGSSIANITYITWQLRYSEPPKKAHCVLRVNVLTAVDKYEQLRLGHKCHRLFPPSTRIKPDILHVSMHTNSHVNNCSESFIENNYVFPLVLVYVGNQVWTGTEYGNKQRTLHLISTPTNTHT